MQIYYYEPQSAGMNVQSPQSESTPTRLTFNQGVIKIPYEMSKLYIAALDIILLKAYVSEKILKCHSLSLDFDLCIHFC